jgi:hypothetical protein
MIIHKEMAAGRWFEMPLCEQMANVGMDVDRAIRWRNKGELELSQKAFYRALELINLTFLDFKHPPHRRKEIGRVKEALVDYFMYDNEYGSSDELWQNYFYAFNYHAALKRGR